MWYLTLNDIIVDKADAPFPVCSDLVWKQDVDATKLPYKHKFNGPNIELVLQADLDALIPKVGPWRVD